MAKSKPRKRLSSSLQIVRARPSIVPATLTWLLGLFLISRQAPNAPVWVGWIGLLLIGVAVAMSLWASLTTYILTAEGLRLRRFLLGGGWSIPLDQIRAIDVRRTWASRLAASSQVLVRLDGRTIRLWGIPSAARFCEQARRIVSQATRRTAPAS